MRISVTRGAWGTDRWTMVMARLFWIISVIISMSGIYGNIRTEHSKLNIYHELACNYHSAERTHAVQWYRSSQFDRFVQDGPAVAWWNELGPKCSPGFDINDDFSLIILNVSLANEGLYRCLVTPSGIADDYAYDVRLVVYATPSNPPSIVYARNTSGFIANCSVTQVFPETPVVLTSNEGSEAGVLPPVVNKDGTYNLTTALHFIPYSVEDLIIINCSYSNFDYKSTSSLRLAGAFAMDSGTDTGRRYSSSELWIGWATIVLEIFFFLVIGHGIKSRRIIFKSCKNQDDDRQENGWKPSKSTSVVFFGRLYDFAFVMAVELIVILLSVVYLAILYRKSF